MTWRRRRFRPPAGVLAERAAAGSASTPAPRVIEGETGRVMRFPSSIPPACIMADYEAVLEHGHPDERWPAST
jgi:hypothetical protein